MDSSLAKRGSLLHRHCHNRTKCNLGASLLSHCSEDTTPLSYKKKKKHSAFLLVFTSKEPEVNVAICGRLLHSVQVQGGRLFCVFVSKEKTQFFHHGKVPCLHSALLHVEDPSFPYHLFHILLLGIFTASNAPCPLRITPVCSGWLISI